VLHCKETNLETGRLDR